MGGWAKGEGEEDDSAGGGRGGRECCCCSTSWEETEGDFVMPDVVLEDSTFAGREEKGVGEGREGEEGASKKSVATGRRDLVGEG